MTLLSSEPNASASAETAKDSVSSRSHNSRYEDVFNRLTEAVGDRLPSSEQHFCLSLAAEDSQFTRFNRAKVRQTGQVRDGQLQLTLMTDQQTTTAHVPFIGEFETDWAVIEQAIAALQKDLPHLPVDPYVVLPEVLPEAADQGRSREVRSGKLLSPTSVAETLLAPTQVLDFSGLYAGGLSYRAYSDSAGKRHWFESPSFTLDYSLFGTRPGQAVKGTLAGHQWNPADYRKNITASQQQLALLERPVQAIAKGNYRTYLAPTAVANLMETVAYGGLGEAALRQSHSAFSKLEQGEATLSEQFSLEENFQQIGVPRFNRNGVVAPVQMSIIHQGRWANALVNARSAKEYGKPSNAANPGEYLRAPAVAAGQLSEDQVLTQLGTGLYLSNLHYLNWSDLAAGRITGMTRYACFWVENGEMVAPIENLRFDDNLYRFLGEGLLALTDKPTFSPAVDTYERRSLGGMWTPGMLIDQFRYTL